MKNRFINIVIVVCLCFAAAVSINSVSLNRIALYVAVPLAFMLSFFKKWKIVPDRYEGILMAIYLWDLFSVLWAQYPESASREMHRVLGAFLLSYIMAVNGGDKGIRPYLYCVFIVLYLAAWYYASNHSLVTVEFSNDQERLNDEILNANTMAYYTFYVSFAVYMMSYLLKSKLWQRIFRVLFLCMIPVSFLVALFTASRQVLIIQVPLLLLLLYERYIKESRRSTKLIFIFLSLACILVLGPVAVDTYDASYLAERAEVSLSEDARWFLLKDAVNIGVEYFPLGVGAGNYINYSFNQHMSHCSYTELFANNGIVGLLLFCGLLFCFIRRQWRYYRVTRDRLFVVFMLFGLIFSVYQVFYVFYTDMWLMSFFILVATHSDSYYRGLVRNLN